MAPFTVTRNALIPAAPSAIFPFVNNFHEWTKWSPWETVDPKLSRSDSGNESGVGAKYAWSGNSKAGSGTMEIVGSDEPGENKGLGKIFALFMNMDKMVGGDFEKGLTALSAVATRKNS
ncbi:SRPBCC family protein [Arthrobacter sp. efr-133-TYG-118]|uniref:SRPBCC family protein n=1 Tax=Arthrobacter sp. efr-133-TYG-118 TaxID=3040279 RepID=UPI00254EBC52|nr:SRPBCC family protein [Arthrobacter sp. efr-133-TYG-118]